MGPLALAVVALQVVAAAGVSPKRQSTLLTARRELSTTLVVDSAAAAEEAAEGAELAGQAAAGAEAVRRAAGLLEGLNATVGGAKNTTAVHAKLSAELDTLQKVYDSLKKGIVRGNTHEREGSKTDAENIAAFEAKIAKAEKDLNGTNLTKFKRELLVNRTVADRAELKYWKAHRGNQHSIFHAQLKMAHGMMDRIKQITEVYKDVLAGKKMDAKKLKEASWGLPQHSAPAAKPAAKQTASANATLKAESRAELKVAKAGAAKPAGLVQAPEAEPVAAPKPGKGSEPTGAMPVKR